MFASSENILVTGLPGCGKSTMIEKAMEKIPRPMTGFFTREIMEKGRLQGFKRAQINIYIGNIPAQRLYEKYGFRIIDEIRDPYFESQIGSPGMARMLRDL